LRAARRANSRSKAGRGEDDQDARIRRAAVGEGVRRAAGCERELAGADDDQLAAEVI